MINKNKQLAAARSAYWPPSMVLDCCGTRWRGRDRRKFSFNDERIPRLTSRSCGELAFHTRLQILADNLIVCKGPLRRAETAHETARPCALRAVLSG